MARMGMDVDAVESAGRALKERAGQIDQIVAGLDRSVKGLLNVWDGPDAHTFVEKWWPEHRAQLVAARSHVDGLGQSALNNASEQRDASSDKGTGGGGNTQPNSGPGAGPAPTAPGGGSTTVGTLPNGGPDGYLAWTQETRHFVPDGNGGHWEDAYGNWERNCTSWVDYRRQHLDPPLSDAGGDGGQVAHNLGGSSETPPSLGAAVSYYPTDSPVHGHVMVVEEIKGTNPPSIRVSEDNYAGGFKDTRVWTQQPDGRWSDGPGRTSYVLEFSPPGK